VKKLCIHRCSAHTTQEVARYLEEIVPPVLACFSDSDARVRYYACESMYNIAKVAKGEILVYFNQVFDALCKVSLQPVV
jgi:vacuole morphology and inheritance protein 14